MKPKTIVLVVVLFAFLFFIWSFVGQEENRIILTSQLQFFGYQFSVTRLLFFTALFAAAAPTAYLTLKVMRPGHSKLPGPGRTGRRALDNARAALAHGKPQEAVKHLEKQTDSESLTLRGRALIALDRPEEAVDPLRKAFFDQGSVEAGYLLVEANQAAGKSPETVLKAILEQHPKDAHRAAHLLLDFFENRERWQDALNLVEKHLSGKVDEDRLYGIRFAALKESEAVKLRSAQEGYEKLIKDAHGFTPAYVRLGDLLLTQDNEDKAFKIYQNGFEATSNPVFLQRMEQFYLQQAQPEEAIRLYRERMVRDSEGIIRYQLAKLYHRLEMTDESLEALEAISGKPTATPSYWLLKADLLMRRGRVDEAVHAIQKNMELLGIEFFDFHCGRCNANYDEWHERCRKCGNWGTIDREVHEIAIETPAGAPVYS